MPPSPPETGPDLSSFEGGSGAAGGIIGTNQLQTAIDKFTQAVDTLDGLVSKMPSAGGGGSNAGGPTFQGGSANAGGAKFTPTAPGSVPGEGMGGGRSGGGGAGGGAGGSGTSNGGWGAPSGGGFTAAGVAGTVAAGLGGGGSGMVGSLANTALSYAPAPVAAAVSGLASAGTAAQPSQIALNTLQNQSSIFGQSYNTTRIGAMGTAGTVMGGQQQVEWGMNPSDMAATYASLQQTTTQINPYATGPGTAGASNVMASMGGMNIANPAMSGQQNSAAVGNLYNPQTSLNMMMMGYPMANLPRQVGTGVANPMPNVLAPFMNRLNGGKPMTQQELFQFMQPGQKGYSGLQNLTGASPQEMQQYTNTMGIQNALMTGQNGQKKMTLGQVDTTFSQLASNNQPTFKTAQNTLQKYGISQSDIQAQKSQAGNQAQGISDQSQGFTAGLQASTRALSDFNTALHKIINSVPGGRGIVGSLESVASNIFGGGAGSPGGVAQSSANTNQVKASITSTVNAKAGQAVHLAETQVGVPYAYGMEAPGVGFDCSALPQWAYKSVGINLPRTATDQLRALANNMVSTQAVQEGDLVFQPGVGQNAHEAMLIDGGKNIIEAKSVGTPISTRPYNHDEWQKAARPWQQGKSLPKNAPGKGSSNSTNVKGGGTTPAPAKATPTAAPSVSNIAAAMEKYMMARKGDAYSESNRWGRPPYDCSSLLWSAANASGLKIPGDPSSDSGDVLANTEANWIGEQKGVVKNTVAAKIKTDDIIFFTGAGPGPSNYGGIGHVGMAASPTVMISAYDTASGVTTTPIAQDHFVVGFTLPGSGSSPTSGGTAGTTTTTTSAGAAGGLGGMSAGLGDYEDEGSTTELDAFGGAILGGGLGGGGTTSTTKASTTPASSPSSSPSGGTPSGTESLGAIAKFLQSAGYSKAAAAGAAGVTGGEAVPPGNPESINCVPLTYKVSTVRGVLAHNEVRVGDVTWTYSPRSGEVVGAIVLAVPYHYDARICLIGNTDWSAVCTWDHKWITDAGLVRADEMTPGVTKILVGPDRYEAIDFIEDKGREDTFCLTTSTGTWTTVTDEGDVIWTGNSGGAGLIGWTPPSAMEAYGGTCKAAGIGNNSSAVDMENQEKAMVKWMKANGWPPPQSSFPQTLAGAMQAADSASAAYERPLVAGSDVHSEYITEAWDALATGGTLPKGGMAWVGERGPELISVSQDSTVHDAASSIRMMSNTMAAPAQGPWSSSGGASSGYSFSTAHPLYGGGSTPSTGVQVTFASGAVIINASSTSAGMTTTGNGGATAAQTFAKTFQSEMAKANLSTAVRTGVSS